MNISFKNSVLQGILEIKKALFKCKKSRSKGGIFYTKITPTADKESLPLLIFFR